MVPLSRVLCFFSVMSETQYHFKQSKTIIGIPYLFFLHTQNTVLFVQKLSFYSFMAVLLMMII